MELNKTMPSVGDHYITSVEVHPAPTVLMTQNLELPWHNNRSTERVRPPGPVPPPAAVAATYI